jgi:hypothetical protein
VLFLVSRSVMVNLRLGLVVCTVAVPDGWETTRAKTDQDVMVSRFVIKCDDPPLVISIIFS